MSNRRSTLTLRRDEDEEEDAAIAAVSGLVGL